jgi:8-oxo-dGTP pyrophosphatase MutT (NUDIX family)
MRRGARGYVAGVTSEREFERIGGETVYEGAIISVHHERYRYADGEEVERDVVRHPGAVGIVCVDDEHVWLVRQPRQAVGDPDVLEIPAGKLDEEGESPLDTGRRELAEEIGKGADRWESLGSFWTSVGVLDEEVHLYLATGLYDQRAEVDEDERIEVVTWPLARLEELLDTVKDSKTRIGLLERHRRRAAG